MGQARVTVHIVAVLAPKRVLSAVVAGKRMTMTSNEKLSACLQCPSDLAPLRRYSQQHDSFLVHQANVLIKRN